MKFLNLSDMPEEFQKGFLEANSDPIRPFEPMFIETAQQLDNVAAFLGSACLLLKQARTVEDAEEALRLFQKTADKMQEVSNGLAKKIERVNS